ncbi:hypothetical protein BGZ61DRAFT_536094 [Ilyonectria robusta]|uniref:uncharacterized protein n=1 Tax=Ilyonectria robusta TaxID=1079257 RepID=UPI001E8E98EF|nr:uncharacterized protein BGZ61DRAFT_536094 [Ilyonectria robusta]KAH8677153.1 hypothetical protein BGZ61DRAFT_536094 [Ilyonectria robusta]
MADENTAEEPLSDGGLGTHHMTGLEIGVIAGGVTIFVIIVLFTFFCRLSAQRAKVKNALRQAEEGGAGRTEDPPQQQDQALELQQTVPGDREPETRRYF